MSRLPERFAELAGEERPGLVTFVTAGDPDMKHSRAILRLLPEAGADIIELGMPFPIRWRMDQPFRRLASALF